MRNPSCLVLSRPDYPPLVPVSDVAFWLLRGERSLDGARMVTGLVTLSAICMLGYAVGWVIRDRLPSWVRVWSRACWSLRPCTGRSTSAMRPAGTPTSAWAAALAAAAVFLLSTPLDDESLRWAVPLLAAALTKQEGLICGVIVAALAVARVYCGPVTRVACWMGVRWLPGVIWVGLVSLIGRIGSARALSGSRVAASRRVGSVARVRPDRRRSGPRGPVPVRGGRAHDRARRAFPLAGAAVAEWRRVPMAVAGVDGCVRLGRARLSREPYRIYWQLRHSVDRTTIVLNLLLLAEGGIWVLTAAYALVAKGATESSRGRRERRRRAR